MKTRITVLNARDGSWPMNGTLVDYTGNSRRKGSPGEERGTVGFCCLGCHALACGVSMKAMFGHDLPLQLLSGLQGGPIQESDPRYRLLAAWDQSPSPSLIRHLEEIAGATYLRQVAKHSTLQVLAASINDQIARRDPDLAVKLLRPVFKEAGLAVKPEPERWIIRYLR